VAVGDFNGDGKPDLAIANYSDNSVSVLLGNGDGTFRSHVDYPTGAEPFSVAVGDFNGDRRLDLAVANWYDGSVSMLLSNGDGTFQARVDYPVGSLPRSVAVGDFNGDGKLDLVVAGTGTISIYTGSVGVLLGNGDGTFQSPLNYPEAYQPSVAVGDFNGDGKLDLVVENSFSHYGSGPLDVLLGNGDGTFQPPIEYPIGGDCVVVGDFNGDGKPDLAILGAPETVFGNSVSILLGNGDGTFQTPVAFATGNGSDSIAVVDLNGDGKQDLAVANTDNSVSVLLGNGDGTFQIHVDYPTAASPFSVAMGDFNGDAKQDLAVANSGDNSVSILLGNGDGTLQDPRPYFATGTNPQSLAVADFNGDGKPDLAVANEYDHSVSVLLGKGDGTFQKHVDYVTGESPVSVVSGDFNGDGKPDLAIANQFDSSVSVLLGNGDGTFQKHVDYYLGGYGHPDSVAVGDFNGDGRLDLAVASTFQVQPGSSVSVLLGNGDGTFKVPVGYAAGEQSVSVAVADFNGDGKLDLLVANSVICYGTDCITPGTLDVLLGNGNGTFQPPLEYPVGHNPTWVTVGDFNGDGKQDVVVANAYYLVDEYGSIGVLLGNGDGTFQSEVLYSCCGEFSTPSSVAIGDFNSDGKPDFAVTHEDQVTVLLGIGDGTFQDNMNYAVGEGHLAATAADLNGDGTPDLAFVTPGNAVSILLNMPPKDFGLSTSPGIATLTSGNSALFTLTATALSGFSGAVSLSCSVSPTPALAPTCALNPQSLNLALNGSLTSQLTVATTRSVASLPMSKSNKQPILALYVVFSSLTVLGLVLSAGQSKRRRVVLTVLLLNLFLLGLGSQIACGGGTSSQPGSSGTPPGQYTVTVNAVAGSITHAAKVTLTVQ
jgi:hypothetical protein